MTVGTFHGIYYGILKWAYRLTSDNILTEEEKYQLIRQILAIPEIGFEPELSDEKEEMDMLVIICIVGGRYCSSSTKQRITCRKSKEDW